MGNNGLLGDDPYAIARNVTDLHLGIDLRVLDRKGMEMSGLGRYGLELSVGLASVRPSWKLTLYGNRPNILPAHLRSCVSATHWPTASGPGRAAWLHLGGAAQTPRRRPDVWFSPTFVLPAWWRRPSVVTIHDLSFLLLPERYRGTANARYAAAATRMSARRATRVLCGAADTSRLLEERLNVDPGKVDVIPYGVSDVFFPEPGALRARPPAPYLLFVGTFEARKGLEILHRALESVNAHGTRVRLVLAGQPGWGTERLLESLATDANVEVILRPADSELARLYREALALVYPSRMEGFGLPVAEAMAAGCPVIASDLACIREFAGDAPMYAPVGDSESVACHVRTLLDESGEREERAQAGAHKASSMRWTVVAEATARVIERAAGATAGQAASERGRRPGA